MKSIPNGYTGLYWGCRLCELSTPITVDDVYSLSYKAIDHMRKHGIIEKKKEVHYRSPGTKKK